MAERLLSGLGTKHLHHEQHLQTWTREKLLWMHIYKKNTHTTRKVQESNHQKMKVLQVLEHQWKQEENVIVVELHVCQNPQSDINNR